MRAIRVVAALLLASVVAACGGGDEKVAVKPAKVDAELVPQSLADGSLVLREDAKATEAFGALPENALVADGKLYAIRQGDRLVATLQLSTLLPEVDLTDSDRLGEVSDKLLPGVKEELRVADTSVFEVAGEDKVVYVWFGRQMFQVLQVKGTKVDPEEVLAELISFQQKSPAWDPLPESEEDF